MVTLAQAVEAGCTPSWVKRQLTGGRLYRMHRATYALVAPNLLRVEGRWLAAVLAAGAGAVLSHGAAGALWGLREAAAGVVDVTVPTVNGRRPRSGIRVHRSGTLLPAEVTVRRSIPVTRTARTIADLDRVLDRRSFAAILRRAEILRLDVGLRREHLGDPHGTELERAFLALCRRHSLPLPSTQEIIGPYTVDFLWSGQRLIVEVDGFATHGTRAAFEDDRARDTQLKLLGYEVLRFTWRQVLNDPVTVASIVGELLDRKSAEGVRA